MLHLRPGTREHFLAELARDWPDHVAAYEQLYAKRSYLPGEQTAPVRQLVARLRSEAGPGVERPRTPLRPPPEPEQLTLMLD
jgi:hypothetical protein